MANRVQMEQYIIRTVTKYLTGNKLALKEFIREVMMSGHSSEFPSSQPLSYADDDEIEEIYNDYKFAERLAPTLKKKRKRARA
jgi:hypothetical protein